jgi:hypothetical protein
VNGAGLEAAFIQSGGVQLLGGLYVAARDSPGPAVLLLDGLPGHEKNLDLATDLRQIGLTCLYVHYRGAWGPSAAGRLDLGHRVLESIRPSRAAEGHRAS